MKKRKYMQRQEVASWIVMNHQDWLKDFLILDVENEYPIVKNGKGKELGQLFPTVICNGKCMEFSFAPISIQKEITSVYTVKEFLKEFLYDGFSAADLLQQFHRPSVSSFEISQRMIDDKSRVLAMAHELLSREEVPCWEALDMTLGIALREKVLVPGEVFGMLVFDVTENPDLLLKFYPWQINLLRKLVNKVNPEHTDFGCWHAITRWANDDIINAANEQGIAMTEAQAEEWWRKNEACFKNLMVEMGNNILADMSFEN